MTLAVVTSPITEGARNRVMTSVPHNPTIRAPKLETIIHAAPRAAARPIMRSAGCSVRAHGGRRVALLVTDMRALVLVVVAGCSGGKDVPADSGRAPPPVSGSDSGDPCADGIQEEHEADVDCGGTCQPCAAGRRCASGSDCATAYCSMDTSTCALEDVSFADAVAYPAAFKPYVLMSADLDGDGDFDLAVANEEADSVIVFRNRGDGTFVAIPASTEYGFPTGQYPTGGAVADVNRDGIPDVVTANYHGNSVSVLLGSGTGNAYRLREPASYPTVAGAETSNLAVGDLNGDGIPDVIATNPQAASMSVFLARADGTLEPGRTVAIDTAQPYSVAIGDFDGDGINDAAVADNRSGRMFIELGNGDGSFRLGAQAAIGGVQSFIVRTYDMDRDGVLDLVVANRTSDDVSVLLGRGDGRFHAAIVTSTGAGTGPYSIAIADFNLDGVPDVATANWVSSTATVLLGRGDGTLRAAIDTGASGRTSYGVAARDFNGDGKPDLATANAASNDMTVKLNTSQ